MAKKNSKKVKEEEEEVQEEEDEVVEVEEEMELLQVAQRGICNFPLYSEYQPFLVLRCLALEWLCDF